MDKDKEGEEILMLKNKLASSYAQIAHLEEAVKIKMHKLVSRDKLLKEKKAIEKIKFLEDKLFHYESFIKINNLYVSFIKRLENEFNKTDLIPYKIMRNITIIFNDFYFHEKYK